MEPGVKKYLLRIVNTLALGLLWMAVNSTAGIMYGLAFVNDRLRIGNILFYVFFIGSLGVFIWWAVKTWSEPIDFDE